MAEIVPFQQSSLEPIYGVRLVALYLDTKGVRTIRAFYADTSNEEEIGDLAFPADETLANWLQDLTHMEGAPALETVSRLRHGEVVVLHDLFTPKQLAAAGMQFRSII